MQQYYLSYTTKGRGFLNITSDIFSLVHKANITTGLCHIFLQHTSASLIFCENADPLVQKDLEAFVSRLIPDGDKIFQHNDEGEDDMPAHIRTILTQNSLLVPITEKKLALGTWQGIYLWEHRLQEHHRKLVVTVF